MKEREILVEAIKREKRSLAWGNADTACTNTIDAFNSLLKSIGEDPHDRP
ncbi:MAG: hypothetical protein K0R47_5966 [Brevibacillus sp.]|nr:hypothetical protein [Brevibacillus sp.]